MFLPALDAFWTNFNPMLPLVHRQTFETSFTSQTGSKAGPPMALAFAMAATGARGMSGHGLSELDKVILTRDFCEKAKSLLFSGYFARTFAEPHERPISDLEAAQATMFLMQVLVPLGKGAQAYQFHCLGLNALSTLASTPHPSGRGTWLTTDIEPRDEGEWIYQELVLRTWMGYASLEASYAYFSNRLPLLEFFDRRTRLPCHDSFFLHDDAGMAFKLLFGTSAMMANTGSPGSDTTILVPGTPLGVPQPTPVVDFPATQVGFADSDKCVQLIKDIIDPVFSCRASVIALLHLDSFFRHLRHRLRNFAKHVGIEPLASLGKQKQDYEPSERLYEERVAHFGQLANRVFLSIPDGHGEALLRGDPTSFFAHSISYFAQPAQAHVALNLLMTIKSTDLEHYLEGDPSAAGPSLFTSPELLPVLECAVVITQLLEGQLKEDPKLRWTHFLLITSAMKIGAISLAAVSNIRSSGQDARIVVEECGYGRDFRVVLQLLEAFGRNFGLYFAKLANHFTQLAVDAGVSLLEPSLDVAIREVVAEDPETRQADSRGMFDVYFAEKQGGLMSKVPPGAALARMMVNVDRQTRLWVC